MENCKPHDVKVLRLCFGGDHWITFLIFEEDSSFTVYSGDDEDSANWLIENSDIDTARRLRDFLIYAVPKEKAPKPSDLGAKTVATTLLGGSITLVGFALTRCASA